MTTKIEIIIIGNNNFFPRLLEYRYMQDKKNNLEKTYYTYNICNHEDCFREVGSQAISYTTGVPAMIGSLLMLAKSWFKPGVWNMEQFDPDPFMELLNKHGLPTKTIQLENKVNF